jgi:hypothetical protein
MNESRRDRWAGLSVALGAAFGATAGTFVFVLTGNGLSIGYGAGVGVAVGAAVTALFSQRMQK